MIAVSAAAGNASVVFAVLSYAGTMGVTVVADDDLWPELDELAAQLQRQLDLLIGRRPDSGAGSA